jgi:tight adherence protein B
VAGARLLEFRRRRQVEDRLNEVPSAAGPSAVSAVRLLTREPSASRNSVFALREWLEVQIESAGVQWTTGRFLAVCMLCAVVGCLLGMRLSRVIPAAAAIPAASAAVAMLPLLYLARSRRRRISRFEAQLPEALDFLARSMRAGNALPISLEMLVEESEEPLRSEFRRVTNEIRLGSPLLSALQSLVRRMPLIDLRMFVSAVLLQRETGGNLSEFLNRIAATIRERFRLRGQVEAMAAQGKLSARVLTALPVLVLAAIAVLSPDYLKIMSDDVFGRKLLAAAAIGQVVGYAVMNRIIRIKV